MNVLRSVGEDSEPNPHGRGWLVAIAGVLAVWAVVSGLGAFLAPAEETPSNDFRKFGVMATTIAFFLLSWLWAAAVGRKRQRSRRAQSEPPPGEAPTSKK